MSSREQDHDEGSLSAPTAPPAPPAAQSSAEVVIGTMEGVGGISPVRPQESDATDLPQQQQRYTSPTESVVRFRDGRRKQARHSSGEDTTTTASLLLSDLDLNEPRTSLHAPAVSKRFELPNFSTHLRGMTFHSFISNIDIPKYVEAERETFLSDFQSEVNARFSGIKSNKNGRDMNARTEKLFNAVLSNSEEVKVEGRMCDIRQCSRYKVEDILRCTATTQFILAIKVPLTTQARSKLKKITSSQKRLPGAWGTKWMAKMNKEEYVLLKCNLIQNEDHVSINDGKVTTVDFDTWYDNNRGFRVQFDGMSEDEGMMNFSWRQLVDNPMDYLFFGTPLMGSSVDYNKIFRNKADANYAHHIFKQLAYECWGDGYASAALLNAYLGSRLEEERKASNNAKEGVPAGLMATLNFRGKKVTDFFKSIDDTIKERVLQSVSTMQFYTEPILGQDIISGWIDKAKQTFPMLMLILSSLRGVTEGATKLIQSKWNQVLFQLFSLARMANPHNLVWFSFIQSVANYGQGVPASSVNNFFGNVCSNATRDRLLRRVTRDVMNKQIQCLSSIACLILVFDNYQKGQHLRFQREKHSSSFLKGTTQVALQGWEWIDDTWNELYKTTFANINYSSDLVIPSAPNMPRLERYNDRECELFAHVDAFGLDVDNDPDFSGKRVDSLAHVIIFALLLGHVHRVFAPEDIPFVEDKFKREKIDEFRRTTKTSKAKALFKAAKEFPIKVVKCWNEFWGKKTPSLFLGLVGIADEKAMETGVLAGDLLVKSGIVIDEGDGNFKLAPDYKNKRHIMVGDAKSVENVKKFIRDVTGRDLSVQQSSNMLQVFLDGLAQVMIIPGDWHAGMAMLQAIYTLWWPLLSVFKDHLGWKRIQQDVRGCYWDAVRLLEFVTDELMRALLYEFVSEHINDVGEVEDGKEDAFICKVVKLFCTHLKELAFEEDSESESDQWRKTWAIFIIMALDFKSFTEAYRNGDSLMVEYGYKRFAPVWEMLGQNKYVARHWDQAETLYHGISYSFSRLMELRINRSVRRYDSDNNEKRMTAHDENLEIWNSFFARFPMVRTLAAFVRQGLFVGLSRVCSIFVRDFYRVISDSTNESAAPTSPKEAKTKKQRQLIFEVLVKSNTHKNVPGRKVDSKMISDIEVTTDLREDGKIGTKTKETDAVQNSSSMDILSAVHRGYRQHVLLGQEVEAEDEGGDEMDINEVVGMSDAVDDIEIGNGGGEDDNNEREFESEWDEVVAAEVAEKEASASGVPLSLQDLWTKGNNKFIAGKVGEVRATAADRSKTHIAIQKVLFKRGEEQRQESLQTEVGAERNSSPTLGMRGTRAYLTRKINEREE